MSFPKHGLGKDWQENSPVLGIRYLRLIHLIGKPTVTKSQKELFRAPHLKLISHGLGRRLSG